MAVSPDLDYQCERDLRHPGQRQPHLRRHHHGHHHDDPPPLPDATWGTTGVWRMVCQEGKKEIYNCVQTFLTDYESGYRERHSQRKRFRRI